jgi:hypothetical protein
MNTEILHIALRAYTTTTIAIYIIFRFAQDNIYLSKKLLIKNQKKRRKFHMKHYKDILALESNLIAMEEAVADILNKDYC